MLRAQREMLEAADKAEAAIGNAHSGQADLVRSAIAAVRDGAGGDLGKLDSALSRLQEMANVSSGSPTPSPESPRPSLNQAEIRAAVGSLEGKARSFQEALKSQNVGDQLRLQRELLADIAMSDTLAKDDSTKQAQAFRSAVSALKEAIASADVAKIENARNPLRQAASP